MINEIFLPGLMLMSMSLDLRFCRRLKRKSRIGARGSGGMKGNAAIVFEQKRYLFKVMANQPRLFRGEIQRERKRNTEVIMP